MARAPKAKRKSPAQVAAGKAFAAAGRASQAASRAAAIKKTGKPPARSKAQTQASLRFAAAGRAAQAAKKAGKAVPKKMTAVAPQSLLALPGSNWPTGCNDIAPTCASVAVAAHLQAATGLTMTDKEILELHKLAGGDSGASIEDVLEAMAGHWGIAGHGRVRLQSYFCADEQFIVAGMVVGVTLGHEGHAVLSAPNGMISWGQYLPWQGEPVEAWALEWSV
jgi:hypothetical protein